MNWDQALKAAYLAGWADRGKRDAEVADKQWCEDMENVHVCEEIAQAIRALPDPSPEQVEAALEAAEKMREER